MTDDGLTHGIEILITGNYPHGTKPHARVSMSGDGSLSHFLDAFRAAMVAAGFALATAAQLDVHEDR